MAIDSQDVAAIAACVSALGVGAIIWQARIMIKQIKSDHERSRRAKSIEMLQLWDERLSRRASISRKLGETFNFEQAKAVFQQEKFLIPIKQKANFFAIFPDARNDINNPLSDKDGFIEINEEYSALLRWELVSYLNSLETVLSAWRHNIADKEMIEEQFEYLVSPESNHFLLQEFRKAAGGSNSFPSIHSFVEHLNEKRNRKNGKPQIS